LFDFAIQFCCLPCRTTHRYYACRSRYVAAVVLYLVPVYLRFRLVAFYALRYTRTRRTFYVYRYAEFYALHLCCLLRLCRSYVIHTLRGCRCAVAVVMFACLPFDPFTFTVPLPTFTHVARLVERRVRLRAHAFPRVCAVFVVACTSIYVARLRCVGARCVARAIDPSFLVYVLRTLCGWVQCRAHVCDAVTRLLPRVPDTRWNFTELDVCALRCSADCCRFAVWSLVP